MCNAYFFSQPRLYVCALWASNWGSNMQWYFFSQPPLYLHIKAKRSVEAPIIGSVCSYPLNLNFRLLVGQIWPNSRQAPVSPRQELSKKVKTVAVAQVKVLKIDGFTKSYNFSTFNGWNLLKNRPHAVRFWVAVIKTIAEVAHTIFSHIQVHKFGWKKFEHPKSILSTASKLPKMATFW